jgi:hypothetical protein
VRELGISALTLTNEQRIRFMAAEEKLKVVGADVLQAAEFFLRFHKVKQPRTLKVAFEEFLASKEASGKRPTYLRTLKYTIGRFVEPRENRDCGSIARSEIEQWLFKSGFQPRTIRGYQIDAQTFFNFCEKRGYLSENPCRGIEKVMVEDTPPSILSVENAEGLINAARVYKDGRYLPGVALGLFAGLRTGEINRLTWDNVNTSADSSKCPRSRQRRASVGLWSYQKMRKPGFGLAVCCRPIARRTGSRSYAREGAAVCPSMEDYERKIVPLPNPGKQESIIANQVAKG